MPVGAGRSGWALHRRWSEPPARKRPHRHTELELNLVTAGSVAYLVQGRRVELRPGAALWLWPEQEHLLISAELGASAWIVVWTQACVRRAAGGDGASVVPLGGSPASAGLLPPRALPDPVAAALGSVAAGVAAAPTPGHEAAGLAWLLRSAWDAFLAADEAPSGTRLHPAVERAARWLAEHAHERGADDLPALAKRCGLSRSRLSRLFAAQVGESLTEHRQRRRLEAALRLLGDAGRDGTPGRRTLLEAALAGGFGSYAQFYRTHVQLRGTAPSRRGP